MAKIERTLNGEFNLFKVNTWGEEAFLDKLREIL